MIRVYVDDGHGSYVGGGDLSDAITWEALRRGILEQVKIVALRTSWDDLKALEAEMATPPEQAALEGSDVPDDEEVK